MQGDISIEHYDRMYALERFESNECKWEII